MLCQRPFLDRVEHLTEDVVSVLPAAVSLEHYIMSLISSACEEELVEDYCMEKLTPYQVQVLFHFLDNSFSWLMFFFIF